MRSMMFATLAVGLMAGAAQAQTTTDPAAPPATTTSPTPTTAPPAPTDPMQPDTTAPSTTTTSPMPSGTQTLAADPMTGTAPTMTEQAAPAPGEDTAKKKKSKPR